MIVASVDELVPEVPRALFHRACSGFEVDNYLTWLLCGCYCRRSLQDLAGKLQALHKLQECLEYYFQNS